MGYPLHLPPARKFRTFNKVRFERVAGPFAFKNAADEVAQYWRNRHYRARVVSETRTKGPLRVWFVYRAMFYSKAGRAAEKKERCR